jgi:hypothetical protein
MTQTPLNRSSLRFAVAVLLAGGLLVQCSQSEPEEKTIGRVRTFDQDPIDTTTPEWFAAAKDWPDTVRWSLDANGEIDADGFQFKMRVGAIKDTTRGEDAAELWCTAEYRMRPVPRWEYARGFKLDSIVFLDPVRTERLPALPMLSNFRTFSEGAVRTRFANDATVRPRVELKKGDVLDPTAFITWDGRTVIVTVPSVPVSLRKPMEPPEPELPDWGPGS